MTLVRLLTRVSPLMVLPSTVLTEGFTTIVTLVWSVVSVYSHVGPQVRFAVELFATHIALNFGLPQMAFHVDDEILLISQNFLAYWFSHPPAQFLSETGIIRANVD